MSSNKPSQEPKAETEVAEQGASAAATSTSQTATKQEPKQSADLNDRARRSCFRCMQMKRRCDNNRPCKRCKAMDEECRDPTDADRLKHSRARTKRLKAMRDVKAGGALAQSTRNGANPPSFPPPGTLLGVGGPATSTSQLAAAPAFRAQFSSGWPGTHVTGVAASQANVASVSAPFLLGAPAANSGYRTALPQGTGTNSVEVDLMQQYANFQNQLAGNKFAAQNPPPQQASIQASVSLFGSIRPQAQSATSLSSMATATTGPPAHYGGPQAGPATGMGHQMSGWPPAGYHPQMDPQTAMMYLQYRPPVTAPPPSYAAGGRGPAGGVVGSGMQAYGAIRMPNFEGMQALGGITDEGPWQQLRRRWAETMGTPIPTLPMGTAAEAAQTIDQAKQTATTKPNGVSVSPAPSQTTGGRFGHGPLPASGSQSSPQPSAHLGQDVIALHSGQNGQDDGALKPGAVVQTLPELSALMSAHAMATPSGPPEAASSGQGPRQLLNLSFLSALRPFTLVNLPQWHTTSISRETARFWCEPALRMAAADPATARQLPPTQVPAESVHDAEVLTDIESEHQIECQFLNYCTPVVRIVFNPSSGLPSSLFVSPQFISLFQFTHVTDLLPQNLLFALRHGVSTRAEAAAVEAQALNVGPGWFRSTRVADRSWPGYKEWRVQSLIRQLPHAQRSTLYVCQPDAMILTSLAAELKQQQRQQGSQQSGQWQGAPPASANHNGKRKRTDGSAGGDGETSGGQRGSADHPSAQHPPPRSPQLQDMPAPSSLETVCMTEQVFQQFASFGGRNYLTSLTFVYTPAAPHDCQEAIDQMSSEMSGPTRPPPPSTTSV